MKRILFLIPSLGGGGAERVLVNLVNNLDRSKYQVTVQTLFDIGVNRKLLNTHITYIAGLKKQFRGNMILMQLLCPKTLYKLLVKRKYDVIVSYLEGATARIVSGCTDDTKLVNWIHVEQKSIEAASYGYRSINEAIECFSRFNRTICVAETVKKDFTSLFKLNHPCEVLYNTNEDSKIVSMSKEKVNDLVFSNSINIISIGRLRKEKGYDRLINVHIKLLEQGIKHHIYILGEGDEEIRLINQINESCVGDTFHLIGFKENPYKYVSKADLFVCSSRREGFSTAVTESLIIGTPVVSTCCSGAYELLGENNEYGIITENSEDGIYDGLYKMLTTPGLLEHYKEKAKERGKMFSKENTVKAVEDMLDSLFEEEK